jgi:phosphoribosylformylglycinamidine synthase
LKDYCLAYGIPLLSGKDSMYIDGNLEGPYGERRKVSGLPTLLFTVSSVIKDTGKCITMDSKLPGDLVYILGETRNELGGSEYYQMMGETGVNVPKVNTEELIPLYKKMCEAIGKGLIASAHRFQGAAGGSPSKVAKVVKPGMDKDLKNVPDVSGLPDAKNLYTESREI